jgi:hypothetical protein
MLGSGITFSKRQSSNRVKSRTDAQREFAEARRRPILLPECNESSLSGLPNIPFSSLSAGSAVGKSRVVAVEISHAGCPLIFFRHVVFRNIEELKGTGYFSKGSKAGSSYRPSAPSSFARFRSNVPNGKWPAFRAVSRIKQSENPNAGRLRYCSSAAATLSDSWIVRSR